MQQHVLAQMDCHAHGTHAVCMHSTKNLQRLIFASHVLQNKNCWGVCCKVQHLPQMIALLQKRGMARIQRTHHPIFQGSLETSTFKPMDNAAGCRTDCTSPSPAPVSQPCPSDEAAAQVHGFTITCTWRHVRPYLDSMHDSGCLACTHEDADHALSGGPDLMKSKRSS